MDRDNVDETRAVARLPSFGGLGIEITHRRFSEPGREAEEMVIRIQAAPSFDALFESNPFLLWMNMVQAAWAPWYGGMLGAPARTPWHLTDEGSRRS